MNKITELINIGLNHNIFVYDCDGKAGEVTQKLFDNLAGVAEVNSATGEALEGFKPTKVLVGQSTGDTIVDLDLGEIRIEFINGLDKNDIMYHFITYYRERQGLPASLTSMFGTKSTFDVRGIVILTNDDETDCILGEYSEPNESIEEAREKTTSST